MWLIWTICSSMSNYLLLLHCCITYDDLPAVLTLGVCTYAQFITEALVNNKVWRNIKNIPFQKVFLWKFVSDFKVKINGANDNSVFIKLQITTLKCVPLDTQNQTKKHSLFVTRRKVIPYQMQWYKPRSSEKRTDIEWRKSLTKSLSNHLDHVTKPEPHFELIQLSEISFLKVCIVLLSLASNYYMA